MKRQWHWIMIGGIVACLVVGIALSRFWMSPSVDLYTAAVDGDDVRVRQALDAGVHPDAGVSNDRSALLAACSRGHDRVVALLLDRGANPNAVAPSGEYPLIAAITEVRPKTVDSLLDHGARVDLPHKSGMSALIAAVHIGDVRIVRSVLEAGADPNQPDARTGETPLTLAARGATPRVVTALLTKGADPNRPNRDGVVPLAVAARAACPDLLALLIGAGASVRGPGGDALAEALKIGDLEAVKLLLSAGADPNHRDRIGSPVLIEPIQTSDALAAVKMLVEAGADVNVSVNNRTDVLTFYQVYGSQEVVQFLLKSGAKRSRAYIAATRQGTPTTSVALAQDTKKLLEERRAERRKVIAYEDAELQRP